MQHADADTGSDPERVVHLAELAGQVDRHREDATSAAARLDRGDEVADPFAVVQLGLPSLHAGGKRERVDLGDPELSQAGRETWCSWRSPSA